MRDDPAPDATTPPAPAPSTAPVAAPDGGSASPEPTSTASANLTPASESPTIPSAGPGMDELYPGILIALLGTGLMVLPHLMRADLERLQGMDLRHIAGFSIALLLIGAGLSWRCRRLPLARGVLGAALLVAVVQVVRLAAGAIPAPDPTKQVVQGSGEKGLLEVLSGGRDATILANQWRGLRTRLLASDPPLAAGYLLEAEGVAALAQATDEGETGDARQRLLGHLGLTRAWIAADFVAMLDEKGQGVVVLKRGGEERHVRLVRDPRAPADSPRWLLAWPAPAESELAPR